jgi:predicted nuclease with TOPRIM domain
MSIPIESDLKEVLGQINQKLDNLQKGVTDLRIELTEVKGDIKALNEKVDGLSKRLDATEFVNRGILVGLIVAILGGFAKLFGLVGDP